MDLPDRLRIVDGEVVLADGGDVRAYLRDFTRRAKIDPNTPVALMSHLHVRMLESHERLAGVLASPA